ncbi:MAG: DUF86 domain-containing protein [Candidatus Methanoperedens sp.]
MEKSDRVRILSKLDEMKKYVDELHSMLPEQEEYQQDLIKRRACEKTVEVAIESLIDVSAMIVSAQQFGLPENEENILDMLIEKKVLSIKLGEKLKDMKGFRNILIHRYGHVDDEIVYHNLSSYMDDFYEFENAVELYLSM